MTYPLSLIDYWLNGSTEHCANAWEQTSCTECCLGAADHMKATAGEVGAIFFSCCLAASDSFACCVHYPTRVEAGMLESEGAPSERIQMAVERLADCPTCMESASLLVRYPLACVFTQTCCLPFWCDRRVEAVSCLGLATQKNA